MTAPLRAIDDDVVIQDLIARVRALGHTVNFGPLILMDRAETTRRLYALLGAEQPSPLVDLDAALIHFDNAVTVIEEEPGDDRPAWVPAEWDIYIDLQRAFAEQDAAWVSGTGIVAVDTLLGADANADNLFDTTDYAPASLTADGYVRQGCVAFIGPVRASLLAGATVAIVTLPGDVPSGEIIFALGSADGNAVVQYIMNIGDQEAYFSSFGSYSEFLGDAAVNDVAANGLAITLIPTRSDVAINGSEPLTNVLTTDDYPTEGPSQIAAALVSLGSGHALQSIGIKTTPLPDTTGLSALSVTV